MDYLAMGRCIRNRRKANALDSTCICSIMRVLAPLAKHLGGAKTATYPNLLRIKHASLA